MEVIFLIILLCVAAELLPPGWQMTLLYNILAFVVLAGVVWMILHRNFG